MPLVNLLDVSTDWKVPESGDSACAERARLRANSAVSAPGASASVLIAETPTPSCAIGASKAVPQGLRC